MDHTFAVIMAGGGGTRLWPVSTQRKPETAPCLYWEGNPFPKHGQRLEGLFPPERILVVTVAEQAR